jgi:hypothetical protein
MRGRTDGRESCRPDYGHLFLRYRLGLCTRMDTQGQTPGGYVMTRCEHNYEGVTINPLSKTENFTEWVNGNRWQFTIDGKKQYVPTVRAAEWLIDRQKAVTV